MTKVIASILLLGALVTGSASAAFAASPTQTYQSTQDSSQFVNIWADKNAAETR